MNTGFQLFQLQTIDSELDKNQSRIQEITQMISRNEEVELANQAYLQSESDLKTKRAEFSQIDYDIQQKKIKKSQSESLLYGGTIKNPKELQDLQQEISFLNKSISEQDDILLDKLISLEQAEELLKQKKNTLNSAVSQFETSKSRLTAEKNNLENTIKSLNVKRQSLILQINQESLYMYDRLRKSKKGYAVASLQDNSCSACGSSLTASQCQQSRSANQLFFCSSCGRIIHG
jgi:predicted  nucleic acid-binding Zn-ribbon protein